MDAEKIAMAMAQGLSAVCATCTLYWGARETGISGDKCLATDGCCSPLGGGDFHEYDGPITNFERFCFVCGNHSKYGIRIGHSVRRIGMCASHIEMMATHRPSSKNGQQIGERESENLGSRQIADGTGKVISPSELIKPRKQTFTEFYDEVEGHYAEKEGREYKKV